MQLSQTPTVMVADNSNDTRDVLKCWLEMKGCRVVEASNGRQAVELTINACPDVILMSMRMPLLGGLEAMRRIRDRANATDFPIVAMSTYPTNETKAFALAAGFASFVSQPIDFDILNKVLASLLQGSGGGQFFVDEREPVRDFLSTNRVHSISA